MIWYEYLQFLSVELMSDWLFIKLVLSFCNVCVNNSSNNIAGLVLMYRFNSCLAQEIRRMIKLSGVHKCQRVALRSLKTAMHLIIALTVIESVVVGNLA